MSRPPTNVPEPISHDLSTATRLALHEERFANGQKAFHELREELAKVKPKPISMVSVFSIGFGVLMALFGAIWSLSELFSEKATKAEVKEVMIESRKTTEQQIEQRVLLNGVSAEVKEMSRKIDVLIDDRQRGEPPRATGTTRGAPARSANPP